jgi:hypothetical protein
MQQLHLPGRLIAYDDITYSMGTPLSNSAIKHVRAPSPRKRVVGSWGPLVVETQVFSRVMV